MSRLQPIVDEFVGTEQPDDTMLEILDALQDTKVILPEDVAIVTAASPVPISSAAVAEATYDLILEAATFLFVPPAPSSIINKSASTMSAPISVAPSISIAATGNVPVSPVPINVPVAVGKVSTAELPAECGCACNVCA